MRRAALAVAALALVCAEFPAPRADAAARNLTASRTFVAKLEASGRASARFELLQSDPFGGRPRRQSGTLALEPPDRARLDFEGGESLAMRSEGGEWLQPALGQLLRMGPDQAAAARRWWSLLLPGGGEGFVEKPLARNRVLVIAEGGADADSAWVTLGADRLPAALRFRALDGEFAEVRFRRWTFVKARGRAAFTIPAPAGITVVDLP